MNFREKYLAEYINKIDKKKFELSEKEKAFFEDVKNRFEKGKPISPHQFNWLKDIAESIK